MVIKHFVHKARCIFAQFIVMGTLLVMLAGCVGQTETMFDDRSSLPENSKTEEFVDQTNEEASEYNNTDATAETDADIVTLHIFGAWNDSEKRNEVDEYVLEDEHAEVILDMFYNHEMQILDSPVESIATLQFGIGEDYLTTSMDALWSLSGRINGELVGIELNDSEYETVRWIVSQYVQDTPS